MRCRRELIGLLCRKFFKQQSYFRNNRILAHESNFPKVIPLSALNYRYRACSRDVNPAETNSEVRGVMLYEVLISTTIAMVLLPFNFWFAAELVILVGLPTIFWELQRYKAIG